MEGLREDDSFARGEFLSARALLFDLVPTGVRERFSARLNSAMVYSTLVTVWILTLQRLSKSMSMQAAVRETVTNHRDIFPDNKRVREGTLSVNPSAYSAAREEMSLCDVELFCDSVSQSLIDQCQNLLYGRKLYVIDGTTIPLQPTDELTKAYPPATNQFGETVWPILLMAAVTELYSGVALRPEFGAKNGPHSTSETAQALAVMERIFEPAFIVADANYGIFQMCYGCVQKNHLFVIRLTNARHKAMFRRATLVSNIDGVAHYQLDWKPSSKDLANNPQLPQDAQISVAIYSRTMHDGKPLHLVTSPIVTSEVAFSVYSERYNAVEQPIHNLKIALNLEQIRSRSQDIVQKELLCGVVAYNLTIKMRGIAAKRVNLPPRRLSFTQCLDITRIVLLNYGCHPIEAWQQRYELALCQMALAVIPHRPNRNYPRKSHPKRPKSTNFERHARKTTQNQPAHPPDV
jgi:hypothetical protein